MTIHSRKLKQITLDIGGAEYQAQLKTWNLVNDTDDPEKIYTFAPDGEDTEDVEPAWRLELTFFSDWRLNGISDWLWTHAGETVPFELVHRPDVAAETVVWTGDVKIKAPNVGGDARATEETEITLDVVGEPVYARI